MTPCKLPNRRPSKDSPATSPKTQIMPGRARSQSPSSPISPAKLGGKSGISKGRGSSVRKTANPLKTKQHSCPKCGAHDILNCVRKGHLVHCKEHERYYSPQTYCRECDRLERAEEFEASGNGKRNARGGKGGKDRRKSEKRKGKGKGRRKENETPAPEADSNGKEK